MPPSSAAIWLAESPSLQSFFNSSTRSSLQLIVLSSSATFMQWRWGAIKNPPSPSGCHGVAMPTLTLYTEETQGSSPPHEISCLTAQTLLYAVSQVQESPLSIPHIRRRHTLSSRRERAFGNSWRSLRFQIRHISATVAPRGARTHPSDQTDASGANL